MQNEWFSTSPIITGTLSTIIEDCHQGSLTGLLRLEDAAEDLHIWFFVNGEITSLFKLENQKWQRIPKSQQIELEQPKINVRRAHLSIPGMRVCELVLNASVEQKGFMGLSSEDLVKQVRTWFEQPEPGFIYLQAERHELFGLIYGDGASNMEVLSLTGNGKIAEYSVERPETLPIRADEEYKTLYYVSATEQEIWDVNRLRLAFAALIHTMIRQFVNMVGQVMANRLCILLTEANQIQGWDIKLDINGIDNNQLFYSLQEASRVYSSILDNFLSEASILIGRRMAKEIVMTMLKKLSPPQHQVLIAYIKNLQGPQLDLGSSSRK